MSASFGPQKATGLKTYLNFLSEKRKRKGITLVQAESWSNAITTMGHLMVEAGDADGVLNGVSQSYPDTIRPAIHSVGVTPGSRLVGVYLMIFRKRLFGLQILL